MALNGTKTLLENLKEFRKIYFDSRLKVYQDLYTKYREEPNKVDPEQRTEIKYFLKKLTDLYQQIEDNIEEETPETTAAIKAIQPVFSAWIDKGNGSQSENEVEQPLNDEIFAMDMEPLVTENFKKRNNLI